MIKIIQLSDWHIQEDLRDKEMIAKKLFDKVGTQINKEDKVAVCICGDIVDKSSIGDIKKKYNNAKVIGDKLKAMLDSKKCKYQIMIVPGNHDIRSEKRSFFDKILNQKKEKYDFDCFCEFAVSLTGSEEYYAFKKQNIIRVDFEDVTWLLCNTAFHGNRKYGMIDDNQVKQELADAKSPAVLIMHHTLFSSNENDTSTLRNGYKLVQLIKTNTLAILHGHTHGYKKVSVGDNCLVAGVGPFLKDMEKNDNTPKQLNVLELTSGGIHYVDNYEYRGDTDVLTTRLYCTDGNTIFSGTDLKGLISNVRNAANEHLRINSVLIQYREDLSKMRSQIDTDFAEQLEIARKWQDSECPVDMWHNHGNIIHSKDSVTYIKQLLKDNPTSRRALITLIDQEQVQKSAKNSDYLPSFDLVQFSFPDNTRNELIISLYMRSLEVGTFLAINLCELYLLADSLQDANLFESRVDISIFANRITEIPDIDTYTKAKIDMVSKETLQYLVDGQRNHDIIDMLIEKKDKKESFIRTDGLQLLKSCYTKPEQQKEKKDITDIISAISNLEKYRKDHSNCYEYRNNSKLEKHINAVNEGYNKLIRRLGGKYYLI